MRHTGEATAQSLDSSQYSTASILHYESVYGEDFVSPGGYDMAMELISKLALEPGSRVLDVGCGLGGGAFVMAHEFGLIVDGIDLSKNMLDLARAKLSARGLQDRVSLEHGDCLKLDRPQHYDAIYSRDVFLHIHDKRRLFAVLYASLRSGGRLLFTDYCCGEKPWRQDFSDYVQDRGYDLYTLPTYAEVIAAAGFSHVNYRDLTKRFIDILQADIERIASIDLEEPVRDKLVQSWRGKLDRALSGDHRWGLFEAEA